MQDEKRLCFSTQTTTGVHALSQEEQRQEGARRIVLLAEDLGTLLDVPGIMAAGKGAQGGGLYEIHYHVLSLPTPDADVEIDVTEEEVVSYPHGPLAAATILKV